MSVSPVRVIDLRCEYLTDPLGLDVRQPRLSWRLEASARGIRQTAYQVLVDTFKTASSQFNLKSMPLLVLIDREGRLRYSSAGFERGQELLITEQLRQLLNE